VEVSRLAIGNFPESPADMINLLRRRRRWKPKQSAIDETSIQGMVPRIPRRSDGKFAHVNEPDGEQHTDWGTVFPFRESYENVIGATEIYFDGINVIGGGPRCGVFLSGASEEDEELIALREQFAILDNHVVNRDCLAASFSLSFNMDGGPQGDKTEICRLRDIVDTDNAPSTRLTGCLRRSDRPTRDLCALYELSEIRGQC
jgi:hypothetical protein